MVAGAKAMRAECEHLGERASELWEKATKMTEDVGALKTAVTDALEEGKEAATKGVEEVRRRVRDLKHMPDEVAHRVGEHPFGAMGMAIGLGLVVGGLLGWFAGKTAHGAH